MAILERTSFARGWTPNADKVNAPADALLRMDNCVLDELGVVALRPGSTVRLGPLADLDVHSLFTAFLGGTKHRYLGAGSKVYDGTGAALITGVTGSGDIAFGSYLGQVFAARGATTKKHDGTTVRNWGLSAPNAPTITPQAPDGKTFATGDAGEAPAFNWDEFDPAGVGSGTYDTGHDGTPNGALVLEPDPATHRGSVTKLYGGPTDFTSYDSGGGASDDDLLSLFFYVDEPGNLLSLQVMIDVNDGGFQTDYYTHTFTPGTGDSLTPGSTSSLPQTIAGADRQRVRSRLQDEVGDGTDAATAFTAQRQERQSWSRLQIRRGDLERIGSTSGLDWTTVRAVRYIVRTTGTVSTRFDTFRVTQAGLTGSYQWIAVAAYDTGQYVGLSGPSPVSKSVQMAGDSALVAVSGIDGQANRVYVFRMGGVMDNFYRTAVKGSGGSGSVSDATSDVQAMSDDIILEPDNGPPPANIISIAGPYFDRVFVLTSDGMLWPSRRINPDSFATGQVIRITGPDETALWVKKAFNGLFVGTTKDLYILEGDGEELPDGEINFTLRALNVDHPPVSDGVATVGNLVLYIADDGWRAWGGGGSENLAGETSQLYRNGVVRHGRGPINVQTGRFRAAVHKGQLVTLAPENTETTSTIRVMRQAPKRGAWYYQTYPNAFRVLYREPDGTLLAGDTAGQLWELESGAANDNGLPIDVVIWTKCDDDGKPYQRKDPWDLRLKLDAGNDTVLVAVHQDGSDSAATTIGGGVGNESLLAGELGGVIGPAILHQLRLTAFCNTSFHLYGFGLGYRDRPLLQYFAEPKPNQPSASRRRFSGIQVMVDTLGGNALVTAILDNVAIAAWTVNTNQPEARSLTFPTVIGRDLWAKIAKTDGFELYEFTPRIVEELPPIVQGLLPKSNVGATGVKRVSGVTLRACTLGVPVTVAIVLDGQTVGTFPITSPLFEPDEFTLALASPATARDVQISLSGDTEVYAWAPIVSARNPVGVKAWDTGPIDLDARELTWIRRADVKVNAGAALTIAFWFDGTLVNQITSLTRSNADTIIPIDVPRGTKGRQPRVVITSPAPFFPYWVKFIERGSGYGTEKTLKTVPFMGASV